MEFSILRQHCVLRPWNEADAESLVRHANDIDIWRNLRDAFPHPYTHEAAQHFLEVIAPSSPQTLLAIEVGGAAVGGIGLKLGTDVERVGAEIGYWLGREHWGKGIVTDAVRGMVDHALTELELERVFALPFDRNIASHRVLEKAEFVLEGRLRRSAIKEGRVVDQLMYAHTKG